MESTIVIVNLLGAVALLLFGLTQVKDGVTRAFGLKLRTILATSTRNGPRSFVSGFFARKTPALPPTSDPTSCASARPATRKLKQRTAEIKHTARTLALAFITTLLLLMDGYLLRLTSA